MTTNSSNRAVTVDAAKVEDAEALAAVLINTWQGHYRGIMPDAFLDSMSPDQLTHNFRIRILEAEAGRGCVYSAIAETRCIGFVACADARSPTLGAQGEIHAINILVEFRRRHIGQRLMHTSAKYFIDRGYDDIGLWVLEKNVSAIQFYGALGGKPAGSTTRLFGDEMLTEIAIRWPSPRILFDHTRP